MAEHGVMEVLRGLAGPGVDVDDGVAAYLVEVIGETGGDDVRALLAGLLEREVSDDELAQVQLAAAEQLGGVVAANDTDAGDADSAPQVLSSEQRKHIHTLESIDQTSGTPTPSSDLSASAAELKADSVAATKKKEKKKKKKNKAPPKAKAKAKAKANSKGEAAATATSATAEAVEPPREPLKEGEFYTNRFERFHKTWIGHDQWKVRGDAFQLAVEELEDDDYSSHWLECLRNGIPWGGRGAGGRGVARNTGLSKDVLVYNVTMGRGGVQILNNSTLKLNYGDTVCLMGSNGCGKSTLLRRIAMGALPGFPPYLRVQYVEQELKGSDMTPVQYVLTHDFERTRLLQEEAALLEAIEADEDDEKEAEVEAEVEVVEVEVQVELEVGAGDSNKPDALGQTRKKSAEEEEEEEEEEDKDTAGRMLALQQRLSDVYERLEEISAFDAEARAEESLRRVGFDEAALRKPTSALSGGWRMRCALVGTIFMQPDVLLLDEPTNSLDVLGVAWLRGFLRDKTGFPGTVLLVSHDQGLVNSVATELMLLRKRQLSYFSGTYAEYRLARTQAQARQANKAQTNARKKEHLAAYIVKQQQSAHDRKSRGGDPKKQKQVQSRKKQMDRLDQIGLGNANGKYFRQSYDVAGLPAAIDVDERSPAFSFPHPRAEVDPAQVIVQLDEVAYGYTPAGGSSVTLVEGFTAQVLGKARIGIVGPNGAGKSTLAALLAREGEGQGASAAGVHAGSVRYELAEDGVAVFRQDMVSELPEADTPVALVLAQPRGAGTVDAQTAVQAREYLGSFGIAGQVGLQPVGTLSGGQRSRVSMALAMYARPRLLVLDEPTSHLDMDAVEVLQGAIRAFQGAVVVISHDCEFLAGVCSKLWVFTDSKAAGSSKTTGSKAAAASKAAATSKTAASKVAASKAAAARVAGGYSGEGACQGRIVELQPGLKDAVPGDFVRDAFARFFFHD